MRTIENLINEFNEITLIKVFEIEALHIATNEKEFILFNIEISETKKPSIYATHSGLTKKEVESNKIAFKSIELDDCFSLDENLQSLYDECNEAVLNSDFYQFVD
jgi:hypothetical protein